jgi:hypothetical protein
MGKVNYDSSGNLWKVIDSPIGIITGANLRKKETKKKPKTMKSKPKG